MNILLFYKYKENICKNGDWGLGIGDWGLGIGDWANPQSPIPNPQSPIPMKTIKYFYIHKKLKKYIIIFPLKLIHILQTISNIKEIKF